MDKKGKDYICKKTGRKGFRIREVYQSKSNASGECCVAGYCLWAKEGYGRVRSRFDELEKNGVYHFLLMSAYNLKRIYGEIGESRECMNKE